MTSAALPGSDDLARAGLAVSIQGAVATVRLDRPDKFNAMTPSMWAGLTAVGAALPGLGVHVVVLIGNGRCFSAGLDRAMLTPEGPEGEESLVQVLQGSDAEVADRIAVYQEGFTWLQQPGLVTIAAVHGYAIGGGFQLALACDIRVVAHDVQLCMKEPALGLVPDLGGTKPLVDAVGYSRALEICATARFVGADEAVRIGLATLAVPGAELEQTAADLAETIAENATAAVLATKALLRAAPEHDLAAQCLAERTAQVPRLRALAGG